jgi:transglutaminase-like putative cysteine protease
MDNRKRVRLVLRLAIIVVFAFIGAFTAISVCWYQPQNLAYSIDQTIVFKNTSRASVTPHRLYIQIPVTDQRQTMEFLGLTPAKYQVRKESSLLIVDGFDALQPNQELAITYSYKVHIRSLKKWWNQALEPSDTQPGHDIESDNELIGQKALELSENKNSDEDKAVSFYEYVAGSIRFDSTVGDSWTRSALDCLKANGGVCGHKANLLTALCRAAGIPARSVSGITLPWGSKSGSNAVGSHAWNEIYVKGKGWCFADPTLGTPIWLMGKRNWGDYDMYRVIVQPSKNLDMDVKAGEDKVGLAACEMTGPCYVLLTVRDKSEHALCIWGDKVRADVKRIKE